MASGDGVANAALMMIDREEDEVVRPLAAFPESIWENRFDSFTLDEEAYEKHVKEIESLKEVVRSMLMMEMSTNGGTRIEKLNLIDSIEQLGISYHFEKEIHESLEQIFNQQKDHEEFEALLETDLRATATHFRLLRQQGFKASSEVFNGVLKDKNGEFREALKTDTKGLLSLYEATHVRTHEDTILEEALSFTTTQLKVNLERDLPSKLAKQVNHALVQSLHKGLPRIEARHYISIYEEDEDHNPLLLRLAKLDYKVLQMLYRQELADLLRWMKDKGYVETVPYSRKRLVETYFLSTGIFSEPQQSFERVVFVKTIELITLIDDTYDAYGKIHELRAFRDAVERWNREEIDGLPKYMKPTYVALLDLCEWVDEEITKRGRPYAFPKYKEELKQYVRTNYKQSCWFLSRELPPFQVYEANGLTTSAYYAIQTGCFLAMESGTLDVFEWQRKDPKILVACSKIARFINDVASHETEKQRAATAIDCYMEHYNVTEEEAKNQMEQICEDAWKDINEELLMPAPVPREILVVVLNLARLIDVLYKHRQDGFTNPHRVIEPYIVELFLDFIDVV